MNFGGSARQSARQIIHLKKKGTLPRHAGATQAIQGAELSAVMDRGQDAALVGTAKAPAEQADPSGSGPCVARES